MHVRFPREGLARVLSIVVAAALALVTVNPQALAYGTTERIGGRDRYETMGLIVGRAFDRCDWAVVASGENYPDALCASALAGTRKCPVILTSPSTLSPQASAELMRLQVKNVYLMGGTAALSADVERAIEALGINCVRVAGTDRQQTSLEALAAALAAGSAPDTLIVATGLGFADALAAAPWAWASGSPIVLTGADGTLSADAVDAIKGAASVRRVLIVGGTAAVSDAVKTQLGDGLAYERLAGADRYATSVEVATWACAHGLGWKSPGIATGSSFADALSAAAMLGKQGSPLLLASDAATQALRSQAAGITSVTIIGGEAALSAGEARAVANAVASPSTSASTSGSASTSSSTSSGSASRGVNYGAYGGTYLGGSVWGGAVPHDVRPDGSQTQPTPTPEPATDDDIAPMEDPSVVDAPVDLWPDEEDVEISGNGQKGRESQFFFAETAKGSVAPNLYYYLDDDYDDELVELDEQTGAAPVTAQAETPAAAAQASLVGKMAPLSQEETDNLDARYDDIDPATHDYWKIEFKELPKDEHTYAFYALTGAQSSETIRCDYWLPFGSDEETRIKHVDERIRALMGENFDEDNPYGCSYWTDHTEEERHALAKQRLDELTAGGYVEDVVDDAEGGCLTFAYVNDISNPEADERGIIGSIEYGDVFLEAFEGPMGELDEFGPETSEGDAAPDLAVDWEDYTSGLQPMGEALQAQAQTKGRVLMINGFPAFERSVKQRQWWRGTYTRIKPTWTKMGYQVTLWDRNITVHTYKQLAGRDFVVLGTHGGEYKYQAGPRNRRRTYALRTFNVAQKWNDRVYTRELKDHQIVKAPFGYKILPRFFTANYPKFAFRHANFEFDSCSIFGGNNQANNAMAQAICGRGAVSAVGFRNSVRAGYAKDVLAEYGKNLLSGMTVGNAFRRTQSIVGGSASAYFYKKYKINYRTHFKTNYDCYLVMYGYDRGGIKYFYRR